MGNEYDFAVIGGGAAGMAAAVSASACGDKVIVIEKSNALGKKILASGNGRCNLMNTGELKYFGDPVFAGKILENYTQEELIQYWNSMGIRLCEESGGRMYPCTFHSATVTDAYKIRLKADGTEILLQTPVKSIEKKDDTCFSIRTDKGLFKTKRILIACGGPSKPKLGGTDDGTGFLLKFGHSILPIRPALCPLTTEKKGISGLSGIRVKCRIILENPQGEFILQEEGEVLFTDEGISGICVMQTARFAEPGYRIVLDLTGKIFSDYEKLTEVLIKRQKAIPDFPPETLLYGILVPRLSFAVMKQAGITMKNRRAGDLSEQEIRTVALKCGRYILTITGNRGLEEAQVSAGGAECSEFFPETMESRLIPGLHAAGEVLNVDGDCGGYNLMFATASGILAGLNGRRGAVV